MASTESHIANRLHSEWVRLYGVPSDVRTDAPLRAPALIDSANRVRAMVMELARPPDWDALSRVWHGVQADLTLPAPAIAVSGVDGIQLWFSLAQPIAVARANAFLDGLRQRYLSDIAASRIALMPAPDALAQRQEHLARLPPALQEATGNWSAFLAPDLVPIFTETPWLDTAPNDEGQAGLLRIAEVTKQEAFDAAFAAVMAGVQEPAPAPGNFAAPEPPSRTQDPPGGRPAAAEAERFLLQTMRDDTVALGLRIDAATALLHCARDARTG